MIITITPLLECHFVKHGEVCGITGLGYLFVLAWVVVIVCAVWAILAPEGQ